jgi:DnaJ-class molecular chaperone
MRRSQNYYDIVGVDRQASPAAIHQAYGHWRTYLKPLLEEEAERELNAHERWSRMHALHNVEEAYDVLLGHREPSRH